jgi:tetratricopeptide (TPR) repeat protein
LCDEAEENNLGDRVLYERWMRWDTCSLCEQQYHGVVRCALGWACWKTYVDRPETDWTGSAINQLGNGLHAVGQNEDALSVMEAELSTLQRVGADKESILVTQNNLANSYEALGRKEQAMSMRRDVYSGRLKFSGDEHLTTLIAANNYALSLNDLKRFEETRALLRKTIPVARRVLGESREIMLWMRWNYAKALYKDDASTLDDLRKAVTTLEETERAARRVLGGAHPITAGIERDLRNARAVLRARETPSSSSPGSS